MRYRINYNGEYSDSLVIKGDNTEEIKEKANKEIKKRNWNKLDD